MNNQLVAELAFDAFPNVSYKANHLAIALNSCSSFDERLIIITQYCVEAHHNGLTNCHHYSVTDVQYKQVFNAMLCLITVDFNNVIRYGMR